PATVTSEIRRGTVNSLPCLEWLPGLCIHSTVRINSTTLTTAEAVDRRASSIRLVSLEDRKVLCVHHHLRGIDRSRARNRCFFFLSVFDYHGDGGSENDGKQDIDDGFVNLEGFHGSLLRW